MNNESHNAGRGWLHKASYAVPILLLAVLLGTYLVSPEFYRNYLLQVTRRERQAVEIVTVLSAFAASGMMLIAARRLWRESKPLNHHWNSTVGAAAIIALIGLASFFFAAEEISWGQTWLNWNTPSTFERETNLHNSKAIPVQSMGSLFLIVMFFVLPTAWLCRKQTKLPEAWRPAVASGPAIFCMAVGFIWKESKNLYEAFILEGPWREDHFYVDFVEQINEQKELLVAVALLMYAIACLKAMRKQRLDGEKRA